MQVEITHTVEGEYDVLAPRGELDLSTYPLLRDRVNELIDGGRAQVLIDLTDTEFLDSTALGALIAGRRKAHAAGGSLVLVCSNPQMLKLFSITKLDVVFTVFPSRDAWRERVQGQPG